MDPMIRTENQSTRPSPAAGSPVCAECGHRIKTSAEQLRVGECTFICDQCYKHLSFPENVTRCSE